MGFQVERLYYTLNEVADRWNLQTDDLLHMAVQEKLRLSFWIEPRIISAYKKNEDTNIITSDIGHGLFDKVTPRINIGARPIAIKIKENTARIM